MECLALNPEDPNFDDREGCGFAPSVAEDQLVEEEIDSIEADVESPSGTTDSDSLTGCASLLWCTCSGVPRSQMIPQDMNAFVY